MKAWSLSCASLGFRQLKSKGRRSYSPHGTTREPWSGSWKWWSNLEWMDQGEVLVEQELSDQEVGSPNKKQKNNLHTHYSAGRSQTLGADPKIARKEMRDRLEPGFYLSETGRKGTLTLHKLGACFAIPGLDYLKYRYAGPSVLSAIRVPPGLQAPRTMRYCERGRRGFQRHANVLFLRRVKEADRRLVCAELFSSRGVRRQRAHSDSPRGMSQSDPKVERESGTVLSVEEKQWS